MKTIELNIGDKKALFTTKSLTLDNVELFYSKMTDVSHDSTNNIYKFTYDGEVKSLNYDSKDGKILEAIFKQVQSIDAKRKSTQNQPKVSSEPATSELQETSGEPATSESLKETAYNADSKFHTKPLIIAEALKEAIEGNVDTETEADAKTETEAKAENEATAMTEADVEANAGTNADTENAAATADGGAEVTEEVSGGVEVPDGVLGGAEVPNGEDKNKEKDNNKEVSPEKKASKKKSFIVFGIIIAALIIASVVYFFVFGTNKAPKDTNPINTESQQYDDIEQLIDDLQ